MRRPDDARRAPEFPKGATWVQGEPVKLSEPKGEVRIVHFWTNGCVNCVRNYPLYRAWGERYKGKPLRSASTPRSSRPRRRPTR